ncbi:MAG TPA: VOC family protein [Solirubrobacteraceae bacterium]|jgi:predicted 3-demethylubiquinone-9 3-methyltransferase (glyoxalase superfamily)|nr:VOC family protein [Solirubrobacteraceae bacterium]
MPQITPFLWFDDQAEQAAQFYVSVFPNSRIADVTHYSTAGPGPAGSVMTVRFILDGNEFLALNGGPAHYGFDESISFMVNVATEDELDHYWSALTDGGQEIACGWLKDRYGLRWQIVPDGLSAVLSDPDPERSQRAAQAMMGMKKLDLRTMREAADGQSTQAAT